MNERLRRKLGINVLRPCPGKARLTPSKPNITAIRQQLLVSKPGSRLSLQTKPRRRHSEDLKGEY